MIKSIAFLIVAFSLNACVDSDQPTNDPPETLTLDGKGDLSDGIKRLGPLKFGGKVENEFTEDSEVHAYTIAVKGGSDVRLDVTHGGTSRDLDTNMFIYAPTSRGLVRIAKDDDSGYGKHSRIDIQLRKDAEFLVVIKPEAAQSRGRYRITLECKNGGCALPENPAATDACPDVLVQSIDECLVETFPLVADGAPDFADLVDRCTSVDIAEQLHGEACRPTAGEFCFEDFENFFIDRVLRNCNTDAKAKYHIEQPVELSFSRDLDERGDQLESNSGAVLNMNAYDFSGSASHLDLVQSSIAFTDWGIGVSITEERVTNPRQHVVDELSSRLGVVDAQVLEEEVKRHFDEIEAAVGTIGDAGFLTGINAFGSPLYAWAVTIPGKNQIVLYEIRDEN